MHASQRKFRLREILTGPIITRDAFEQDEYLRALLPAIVLISILLYPTAPRACSMVGCINNGVEMRPDFVVKVTHDGKPLARVSVVVRNGSGHGSFSGITVSDGTVHVTGLAAGEYWLETEFFGIDADVQCFHIANRTSRKAKRKVEYEWGDFVPATRQMAGRLIDIVPASPGGTPIWNLLHSVNVPIDGAKLRVQDPFSGAIYSTVSDVDGHFSFSQIPDGLYVFHVPAGTIPSGRQYESTDVLIRLSDRARWGTFEVVWRLPENGSCGGASLEFQNPTT